MFYLFLLNFYSDSNERVLRLPENLLIVLDRKNKHIKCEVWLIKQQYLLNGKLICEVYFKFVKKNK